MQIKYFGKNKETGMDRVAVIRFTDDEFDLYKFIENYERTYGEATRMFACGGLVGIERNEKGVWINESYISVDDFSDFNDFKANYKEAKKEFKSLKKQVTETKQETATETETTETKQETTDSETTETESTEKEWTVTQFPHVVRTFDKNGKMVYESFFETAEKAYDEYVDIIENSKENLPHGEELTVVRFADGRIMCSETIKGTCIYNSMRKSKATEETVYHFERLTKTLCKSLFKSIGIEETKKIHFIISNNMVFFNYNGTQYKYYPSQCKIFKKCGRKYQRINWKNFADDNSPTVQKQAFGRSPPLLLI